MKVNKRKVVDLLVNEILQEVSVKIREIVREEIDIERKRLRKQLLEEFRGLKHVKTTEIESLPDSVSKRYIDTGSKLVNEILNEAEESEDLKSMFQVENKIQDVSQKPILENRHRSGELWTPPKGEAYNFNPKSMDPAQIDWSNMVDALEDRARKSRGPA